MSFKSIVHKTPAALLLFCAFVAGIVFYYIVDPESSPCFRCPFEYITGLKCPGCGSQRALHHILHFEFLEALKDNALFVVMIPILLMIGITWFFKSKFKILETVFNSKWFAISLLFLITLWFVGRNCSD